MRIFHTKAFLLKQTFLSTNDVFLTFYSEELGKIQVFAPKFLTSKKRKRELDFFRLLEIEVFEGCKNFYLQSVRTLQVFSDRFSDWESCQMAFSWLQKIDVTFHSTEDSPVFFSDLLSLFLFFDVSMRADAQLFFDLKFSFYQGVLSDSVHDLLSISSLSFDAFLLEKKSWELFREQLEFLVREN